MADESTHKLTHCVIVCNFLLYCIVREYTLFCDRNWTETLQISAPGKYSDDVISPGSDRLNNIF